MGKLTNFNLFIIVCIAKFCENTEIRAYKASTIRYNTKTVEFRLIARAHFIKILISLKLKKGLSL